MNFPYETPEKISRWLGSCLDQVEALAEVGPNWDSYGAAPVDRRSIELAKQFLMELPAKNIAVEAPAVSATPSGNVALCWDDGQRNLDLEVRPDGAFRFAYIDELAPRNDRDGMTQDAQMIAELLTK